MRVNISSTVGRLEGIYKKSDQKNAPCVLIMHPHPLYDGNMYSKIVVQIEKAFLNNGFTTLRFNFRGVGNSEGVHGDDKDPKDYITDASTCCDWLHDQNLEPSSFWVAGFSFGAFMAMQIMTRRIEVNNFISVALPANMYDISFIYPCPADGLFLHGERDDIAPFREADKIIKKAMRTKGRDIVSKVIKNADHFFTNQQAELFDIMDNYIRNKLEELKNPNRKPKIVKPIALEDLEDFEIYDEEE